MIFIPNKKFKEWQLYIVHNYQTEVAGLMIVDPVDAEHFHDTIVKDARYLLGQYVKSLINKNDFDALNKLGLIQSTITNDSNDYDIVSYIVAVTNTIKSLQITIVSFLQSVVVRLNSTNN